MAQLREHLIARNKLNFAAVNLAKATFNFDTPRFLDVRIGGTVKRFDQAECKIGTFSFGQG